MTRTTSRRRAGRRAISRASGPRRCSDSRGSNTIRVALDLLGDDSQPASILPDDDRVGSFPSNSITHAAEHTVALYAQTVVVAFGRRASHRPLRAEGVDRLLAVFERGEDFANGIRLVLEAILQSPHFVYRVEGLRARIAALPVEVDARPHAPRRRGVR